MINCWKHWGSFYSTPMRVTLKSWRVIIICWCWMMWSAGLPFQKHFPNSWHTSASLLRETSVDENVFNLFHKLLLAFKGFWWSIFPNLLRFFSSSRENLHWGEVGTQWGGKNRPLQPTLLKWRLFFWRRFDRIFQHICKDWKSQRWNY